MLADDLARRILAGAAAAAHGELALDFGEGARAAVDSLSNLPIRYRMTNADVHSVSRL